ncbi:hypothetical protein O181_005244 [Austropuccinia psidii MF-1]|uniref:Uncharacterized protein n=1 Tax=Austropuccinia psidii MF-1 TaxID=1389203 RepID=A0A9Q3BHR1_9BASI|nr:hypothetical protein [Austropuccinia psidii MF-1]
MSSSNDCKSYSGSVQDLDSESSIEYFQAQSPMSPKILLQTTIASSINVSGLNIDVGNAMSENSTTWTIPDISVTPIPLNPTNTQMHLSDGTNPPYSFSHDLPLNPGHNPVGSQEPLVKSKQPFLNSP